jgi:ribonuclease G
MAKEICISSTPHETRLAILEDDQLAEIYYERENEYTLAGSIYNGRVTRVLPGMQSAFVDIGLERDAFLYVTDFLELEDQEETNELEKAAATSGNQAPREVHHAASAEPETASANRGDRWEEERSPRRKQRSEPRQEQPPVEQPKERRHAFEPIAETEEVVEAAPETAPVLEQPEESGSEPLGFSEQGTRRWRGRRRRRGGRGGSREAQPELPQESGEEGTEYLSQAAVEPEISSEELAASIAESFNGQQPEDEPSTIEEENVPVAELKAKARPSRSAGHTAFVLPGESLTKYGGTAASEAAAANAVAKAAAPAKPASSFKPASLVEGPIAWDGSGLLPGESLSRHSKHQATAEVEPQAEELSAEAAEKSVAAEPVEVERPAEERAAIKNASPEMEQELVEEETEEPVALQTSAESHSPEEFAEEELVEEELQEKPAPSSANSQSEAKAAYDVDPLPPSGFRLFGFGSKKKKDEEDAQATDKPATLEEDFLEEEAFSAPRKQRQGKPQNRSRSEQEEGSATGQTRTGEIGELLHDAQLNHRFELEEENKGEEETFSEEDDAEQSPAEAQGQQRRGRNRRGRNGAGGQQGAQGGRRNMPSRRSSQLSNLPIISDLLKPGQEILVQIAKEPIAKKGARITSHIALPGRFLVFMPTVNHVGVSRKIESDEERQRLKRILVSERGEATGGFIVRTAAEGASEEDLRADLRFLLHLWNEIKSRSDSSKSPSLIYHDLSLIERILRDQVSSNFSNIWVDSEADYERIVRFLNRFSPSLVRRVKLYTKETPLFEHFGIQDEISKALRSKVWLKSGGSIVINQTEALVAIDINTGKYVGKSARLEDTIVKTNLDAVPEIVRQIRLRDLGGIIVIDFIDMDDRKNRFKVMAALEEALKSDRAPTKVLQFNDFGLVAITRKRVKQSLERTLSVPCPTCQATGMVKSPTTVCNEIYIELRKMKKYFEGEDVMLRVHPETVKVLKANNASWLMEFEELVGKNILIKSDPALHPEQFDIQG